jgi:hypothetical protein
MARTRSKAKAMAARGPYVLPADYQAKRPYVPAKVRKARKAARVAKKDAKDTETRARRSYKKLCRIKEYTTPKRKLHRYQRICPPRNSEAGAIHQGVRDR